MSKSILQPGEKAHLKVVYSVIAYFGELPEWDIILQTDDRDNPEVRCSVGGYRQRRFVIEPNSVDFGVVLTGDAPSRQVTVVANGKDMRLTPERIMTTTPWVAAKVIGQEPLPEGGDRWVLKVNLKKEAPIGRIDGNLFIPRTQDDGVGPIIRVMAEVSGPVRLAPATAFLGILAKDGKADRTVELRPFKAGNKTPKIMVTGFGKQPRGIHLKTDARNPALVHVLADPSKMESGQFAHQVVIRCVYDDKPCELLLPVTGMID